jgi:CheY-like chemotaxis protein
VIKEVRRLGGAVPAVALKAFARSEDRVRSIRAGFQAHVAKPIESAELLALVAGMTGRNAPAA